MREVEVCLNGDDWIPANKNSIHKIFNDSFPRLIFIFDEIKCCLSI